MNRVVRQSIVLCLLISAVVLIAVRVDRISYLRDQAASGPVHKNSAVLPEDVESVLKGYKYFEKNNGLLINISGKQIIRRGKKILGLRSNLVKSNFFKDIYGTVAGINGTVVFSASDAEWDADTSHPLMLKKNVSITVNDETFSQVRRANLFFNQGIIKVTTDRTRVYNLK